MGKNRKLKDGPSPQFNGLRDKILEAFGAKRPSEVLIQHLKGNREGRRKTASQMNLRDQPQYDKHPPKNRR